MSRATKRDRGNATLAEEDEISQSEDMDSEGSVSPLNEDSDKSVETHRELSQEEVDFYKGLMEAILFVSTEPLTLHILSKKCELDRVNTRIIVDSIVDDYSERDGGILLKEVAGGYQFITSERYSELMGIIFKEFKKEKLTRTTMEVLAIISYRQPITLPEIDDLRGAASRPVIASLLAKKLIKPQGFKPVPGKPTLYVTTKKFLMRFGLNSLADLPPLDDLKELKFEEID